MILAAAKVSYSQLREMIGDNPEAARVFRTKTLRLEVWAPIVALLRDFNGYKSGIYSVYKDLRLKGPY